jgi:lipid-binding SYLF domain-containing protein
MRRIDAVLVCLALGCQEQSDFGEPLAPNVGHSVSEPAVAPPTQEPGTSAVADDDPEADARQLATQATNLLSRMRANSNLRALLEDAKGLLLIPRERVAVAGVGLRSGSGVLLVKSDETWSGPAFFDIGAISVGPRFESEQGEFAMILLSDDAIAAVRDDTAPALNTSAQLSLVDFSMLTEGSFDEPGYPGDVVFWSPVDAAFVGTALNVSGIVFDKAESAAYFDKNEITASDILDRKLKVDDTALQRELGRF